MNPSLQRLTLLLLLLLTGALTIRGWGQSCPWSAVGPGAGDPVLVMQVFDDGAGPGLYCATFGGLAVWDGTAWSIPGSSSGPPPAGISAMEVFDDGTGPALYVGGAFVSAGGAAVNGVARWDGTTWSAVGGGVSGGVIKALEVFDDGSGPALYAGGDFSSAGGSTAGGIARWNGTGWSSLPGLSGSCEALRSFHDGAGPALYAGGAAGSFGGVPANNIARWDGVSWSPLAAGSVKVVKDLEIWDDGAGPALYAAAPYDPTFPTAAGVARWDGVTWIQLGNYGGARRLAVFDDGTGSALYGLVGAPGVPALRRWTGVSWTHVTGFTSQSQGFIQPGVAVSLAVFDDGTGSALYAGGAFNSPGDGIARTSCGAGISLAATQPGPGAPLHLSNGNLTPGHEYYNLFSIAPCPGGAGTGTGPLGLCLSSATLQALDQQLQTPVGTEPFHFVAPSAFVTRAPLPGLPAMTLDAFCVDVTGGVIGSISPIVRVEVQ